MKYIGENAIKKLISLIKGDLATKQPTITASGLLKGDGTGTITAADTQEATLVDVPNGLLKGDGSTLSAAVAGTDYITPDGMNSAVAETKPFIVTMNDDNTTNKTVTEIKAAYDAGRTCVLDIDQSIFPLVGVTDGIATFSTAVVNKKSTYNLTRVVTVIVTNGNIATVTPTNCQDKITATGLLKGNGNGGVSAAVAGTDYVLPSTLDSYAKKSEIPAADTAIPDATITSTWNSITI